MVPSKNFLIPVLLCLFVSVFSNAQTATDAENYLTAIAKAGDDALDLLDRYGLAAQSCNVNQFLKINDLDNNRLKAGESYLLPVLVVVYNGKSIRTTLDISDWKTAKRIEEFNKTALRKGLRPSYFIENKQLWVPWHEISCEDSPPPKTAAAAVGAIKK